MWLKRSDMGKECAEHQFAGDHRLGVSFRDNDFADCHRHMNSDESILVVDGKAFCDIGEFNQFELGDGAPFYCRIPRGMPHRVRLEGAAQFINRAHTAKDPATQEPATRHLNPIRMLRTGTEAFHCSDPVVIVGKPEVDRLKAELPATPRARIRLCMHDNARNDIHEMIVLYTKDTYIQPNKHIAKDETFHIIEGEADFIFYNDSGDVQEIVPLGDFKSGKAFYVRVEHGRYHAIIMHSDYLVIHEATPGPYDRSHTVWAPWAKPQ